MIAGNEISKLPYLPKGLAMLPYVPKSFADMVGVFLPKKIRKEAVKDRLFEDTCHEVVGTWGDYGLLSETCKVGIILAARAAAGRYIYRRGLRHLSGIGELLEKQDIAMKKL